eukprot:jgi/Chrzof1/5929/Cz16g20300.t1
MIYVLSQYDPGLAEYFHLIREWPITYCVDHHCPALPDGEIDFLIHGLWPEAPSQVHRRNCDRYYDCCRFDEDDLQVCDRDEVLLPELSDLETELPALWHTYSSTNCSFWQHEWEKHGTCTGMNKHEYFDKALGLARAYDIKSALNKAGIELDKYYSVQDIKDALGDAYPGVQAELTCHPSRRGRGIRRADCPGSKCGLLDSVYICFNNDWSLKDCDSIPQDRRQGERCEHVKIPSSLDAAVSVM